MNKKVITLCAAALLFGAGVNSAYADPVKTAVAYVDANKDLTLSEGVKFYLGTTANALYSADKVTNNKKNYQTAGIVGAVDNAAVFEVRNLKTVSGGVEFDLYVNGIQFAVKANGASIDANTAAGDIVTRFAVKKTKLGEIEDIYPAGVGTTPVLASVKPFTATGAYNADELKEFNSVGTTFSFETKKNLVGNEFSELTPFDYEGKVIFVKGKSADISAFLADPTVEATAKKVKVLALSNKSVAYNISGRDEYEGLKLRWMPGENFKTNAADSTSYAKFGINAIDVLNNELELELSMSPDGNDVYVKGVTPSASDINTYVTSINQNYNTANYAALVNPTLGSNTYLDASVLLKDTKNIVSIYFTSGSKSQDYKEAEQQVYHKYLVANGDGATVLPANDIDFASPAAQWVVSDFDGKYTFTLTNRFSGKNVKLKLQPNGDEGGYKVVAVSNCDIADIKNLGGTTVTAPTPLPGTSVKFKTLATTATDGFLKFTENQMKNGVYMTISGKDAVYGEQIFNIVEGANSGAVEANLKDKDKLAFIPEASKVKTISVAPTAYLKDGKIAFDKDTLEAPAYLLKVDKTYLLKEVTDADKNDAYRVVGAKDEDGGYTLYALGRESTDFEDATNAEMNKIVNLNARFNAKVVNGSFEFSTNNTAADFQSANFIDVVKTSNSLEAKTRYASLDNVLGSITYQLNKNNINEGILKDTAIFRLNVVDTAAIEKGNLAEFYISKYVGHGDSVRMFMYNAADSMRTFIEGTAQEVTDAKYILEGTENDPKVIFQPASLIAADKLVLGADTLSGKGANAYKFNIVSTGNEGEYTINSVKDGAYVYALNGRLGLTDNADEAFKFTLGADQMPTANEAIATSEVVVAATDGAVVVKGAAGKAVVVTNILGQTLANEVVSSDNATIAVPAGIVVVAVEGEEAAKVVVK